MLLYSQEVHSHAFLAILWSVLFALERIQGPRKGIMMAPALASIYYERHRNGREKWQYRKDRILVPLLLSLLQTSPG